MNKSPMIKFENDIAETRQKYKVFQGMASRTNRALWEALRGGYAQILDYRNNAVLRVKFDLTLVAKKMRFSQNMLLTVTEYIFFPHVLRPGTGHKAAINRASIYAAVYEKALAANISAADFVPFIRENGGIQKIATEYATQPNPQTTGSSTGRGAPRKTVAICEVSTIVEQRTLSFPRLAGETWYSNAALAVKAAEVLQAAYSERLKIHLVIYAHRDERVVVGVSSIPWKAPTPVSDQKV